MNTNKIRISLLSIFIVVASIIGFKALEPIRVDATTTTTAVEREYVGENFCGEESAQRLLKIAGYVLIIAKVCVPLIIIVVGTIDVFHAVIGKDSKVLGQKVKTLGIRIFLGVFIFFIPSIVGWGFDLLYEESGEDSINMCVECMLSPTDC